jgi:protein-tyrosine phosphatase
MPTVIDWTPTVDPSELVRQTRDALTGGSVVVLPGDCGYVAVWRSGSAVELPAPAVLAWGPDEVAAQVGTVPAVARRLMFRAWPAPLVVEIPTGDGVRRFRFPEHPLFELVIPAVCPVSSTDAPVLVADLGASTAAAAATRVGGSVGLVVNAGEIAVARPTVVRVADIGRGARGEPAGGSPPEAARGEPTGGSPPEGGYTITELGAFPADEIERLAARIVLFVCTGNTCRSPLAEGLAKKALADRLGCTAEELPRHGFWVLSAGVAAHAGAEAAMESVVVAAELGADLSGHASRPVNPQLLQAADDVIAMTHSHLHALAVRYPGFGPAARLLCGDEDLDDPIGAGEEVYRACARTILRHLDRFLPEWVGS